MDPTFNERANHHGLNGQRQGSVKRQISSSGEQQRLEKKKSLPRTDDEEGGLRLQLQTDTRDHEIKELRGELEKLRKTCTCVICQDLLFEPFIFQCGHVYCYSCISQWLAQGRKGERKFCPQCREVIETKPAPAYLIREMVEIFVQRAQISSPGGQGAEWRQMQREQAEVVKKDQEGVGLFGGQFDRKKEVAVYDAEDGVPRCVRCHWEIEHRTCSNPHCGARYTRTEDGLIIDSDDSGSSTEEESDSEEDLEEPDRWPESVIGDTTGHETEDDEDDDDGWSDEEEDVEDEVHLGREYYHSAHTPQARQVVGEYMDADDDDDDDEPITNRSRAIHISANLHDDDETDDGESESDYDDGDGFVVRDTPVRNHRSRSIWEPGRRRPNARRTVVDEDDEDTEGEQTSASEASSVAMPQRRPSHVTLSPYSDDESSHLLSPDGYQALHGGMTTDENETDDDGSTTPPVQYLGTRRRFSHSMMHSPGVLTISEEDETSDEEHDNEDADGDVRMSDTSGRSERVRGSRRRRRAVNTQQYPIDVDSGSDSEPDIRPRRRRPAASSVVPPPGNYLGSGPLTASRSGGNQNQVDPRLQGLFQWHSARLAEQQFDSLGSRNSSVSPARSLTPVQRDINNRSRAGRSRTGTPLAVASTPPPFSPLQQTHSVSGSSQQTASSSSARSSREETPTANPSPSPGRLGGSSSAHHSTSSSRASTLSPRASGNTGWQPPSHLFGTVQRTASPVVRVRSRASRPALRSSTPRGGIRPNVASPSSSGGLSVSTGTNSAGSHGRQSSAGPSVPTGGVSLGGRRITSADVRQVGYAVRQQQRMRQSSAQPPQQQQSAGMRQFSAPPQQQQQSGLRQFSAPPLPDNIVNLLSSPSSSSTQANGGDQAVAWIGGESADGRSGGPGIRFSTEGNDATSS